ncbi:MAG TPA: membrane protein insertion efficiency factor YidD [Thermoanaerobaculia bacterium]|nr:membrane protein insertion efficiency factor YidD [Thermoanaerobaculia bacterium]
MEVEDRRRLRKAVILLALAVLLGFDLARPAHSQVTAKALLGAIHLYQATLSPHMSGLGVHCRFQPTCSHFAVGAIQKDGALVGTLRAAGRVVRCGPWTPMGTYDPP